MVCKYTGPNILFYFCCFFFCKEMKNHKPHHIPEFQGNLKKTKNTWKDTKSYQFLG